MSDSEAQRLSQSQLTGRSVSPQYLDEAFLTDLPPEDDLEDESPESPSGSQEDLRLVVSDDTRDTENNLESPESPSGSQDDIPLVVSDDIRDTENNLVMTLRDESPTSPLPCDVTMEEDMDIFHVTEGSPDSSLYKSYEVYIPPKTPRNTDYRSVNKCEKQCSRIKNRFKSSENYTYLTNDELIEVKQNLEGLTSKLKKFHWEKPNGVFNKNTPQWLDILKNLKLDIDEAGMVYNRNWNTDNIYHAPVLDLPFENLVPASIPRLSVISPLSAQVLDSDI